MYRTGFEAQNKKLAAAFLAASDHGHYTKKREKEQEKEEEKENICDNCDDDVCVTKKKCPQYAKTKHDDGREIFLDTIHKVSDFSYMIFTSKRILKLIKEKIALKDRKYLIDAIFKIVPFGQFGQLLMIYVKKFDTVFPFAYILMDKRTAPAYTHVFQYINAHIFPLSCTTFVSDFETEMRNALRVFYPTSQLVPCWFHHKQAVRKKVSKCAVFFHLVCTDKDASMLYQKFQALALLPAESIEAAFYSLKDEALAAYGVKCKEFVDYFERQWIKKVNI